MLRTALSASIFACCGLLLSPASAQSTAATQTSQDISPKDQVLLWQDQFDQGGVDQVLPLYAVHSDDQLAEAKVLAAAGVSINRLIKLAGQKFGPEAGVNVAHTCGSDSRDDDKSASVRLYFNHAVMSFKSDAIDDLLLVREEGHWKIDMPGYEKLFGPNLPKMLLLARLSTPIADKAADDVAAGKYDSAAALNADLLSKFSAMQAQVDKQFPQH